MLKDSRLTSVLRSAVAACGGKFSNRSYKISRSYVSQSSTIKLDSSINDSLFTRKGVGGGGGMPSHN